MKKYILLSILLIVFITGCEKKVKIRGTISHISEGKEIPIENQAIWFVDEVDYPKVQAAIRVEMDKENAIRHKFHEEEAEFDRFAKMNLNSWNFELIKNLRYALYSSGARSCPTWSYGKFYYTKKQSNHVILAFGDIYDEAEDLHIPVCWVKKVGPYETQVELNDRDWSQEFFLQRGQ